MTDQQLGHQFGVLASDETPIRYYHWPEHTEAESAGLESLPWEPGDFDVFAGSPNIAIESGYLRLTTQGLSKGQGTYTSPVVDLIASGVSVVSLSGVYYNSEEGADQVASVELRWHSTTAPVTNASGVAWQTGELPNSSDPVWNNSLTWTSVQNADLTVNELVRYVQWRAVFTNYVLIVEDVSDPIYTEDNNMLSVER